MVIKLVAVVMLVFSVHVPVMREVKPVQEEPCTAVSARLYDAGKIVLFDEAALDDNANMLGELIALNDPKVNAILAPHMTKQIEYLENANKVREKYQK